MNFVIILKVKLNSGLSLNPRTCLNTHPGSDLGLGRFAVNAAAAILQDDPGPAELPELHGSAGSAQSHQHVESGETEGK